MCGTTLFQCSGNCSRIHLNSRSQFQDFETYWPIEMEKDFFFFLQFEGNVNWLVTYWCDSEALYMLGSCECK